MFSVLGYQAAVNIVKETIQEGRSGEEACKELVERCRQYGKVDWIRDRKTHDDISVIILFFHISKHTKSHGLIDKAIIQHSRSFSDGEEED